MKICKWQAILAIISLAGLALCPCTSADEPSAEVSASHIPHPSELWPMPEDNGWDDLLAAIEMVRRPTPPPSDRPSPPPVLEQPEPYGPGYRNLLPPGWKDELSEEELRKALRPLEPALARLDVALSKPFTHPESSPWEEGASRQFFEELRYVRQFAIVLTAKAHLHQMNSNDEQARGAFEKALALANRFSQGGSLIHRRMGIAMRAIALQPMQSWIANRPPVATLEGTADFLEQLAEQQVPRWKIVATEAWLRRQRLETWYAGAVSEEALDWWAKICPELRERPIVSEAAALEMWRQHYQQLVQIARLPLWEAIDAQLPEPDAAQLEAFRHTPKSFRRWLEINALSETELGGTRIMVALELYRYDQPHEGWYPARLRDLVPHYLTELPQDPFTGESFLYRRTGRFAYKLYSAGPNKIDDGGKQTDRVRYGDPDIVIFATQ